MLPQSKVDLKKAYDSVNWDFLESVLLNLRFPVQFVNWIMRCVRTTSYSICINGELQGQFNGAKGLRQGAPLLHFDQSAWTVKVLCQESICSCLAMFESEDTAASIIWISLVLSILLSSPLFCPLQLVT